MSRIGLPLISRTRSPTRSPARCAGLPGSTTEIVRAFGGFFTRISDMTRDYTSERNQRLLNGQSKLRFSELISKLPDKPLRHTNAVIPECLTAVIPECLCREPTQSQLPDRGIRE